MRAALRDGPKKVNCIEIDKPVPLKDEVLVLFDPVAFVVLILSAFKKIIQNGIKLF